MSKGASWYLICSTYCWDIQIRAVGIVTYEEKGNALVLLARNPQGIRPLGMSVCRWERVVKVVFNEVCWDGVD